VIAGPVSALKHKLDLVVKTTAWGSVAAAAAVIALGFFCAAGFVWLAREYGTITACLALGGLFVIIALIALIAIAIVRHRPPPPPQRAWWADPAVIASALDATRALGGRRVAPAALISAFLFGFMLSRSGPRPGSKSGSRSDPKR
jgi:hypothetical protein